jgi:alpha-amylase/alpha-mannosidase (GH57 family)
MPDKLKVVFCWHMHQPYYRDWHSGQYQLPWTYLHSIKDYVDMVAHLEAVPEARAVVNFVPILLEQIDDYTQQIQKYLQGDATSLQDPLLAALVSNPPYTPFLENRLKNRLEEETTEVSQAKIELIEQCLRANQPRIIQRFKPYQHLTEITAAFKPYSQLLIYLDDQYFIDLVMWYHLAWMGETVRRHHPTVQALMKKGRSYTDADRRQLLAIIGTLVGSIIPRYQSLAARGQLELSFSPYSHPIMPLLLNVQSAHEALPDLTLPALSHYADGEARVRWHLQEGLAIFKKYFGITPQGCWPSEGCLSEATVRLIEELGIQWVASGESVLRKSLNKAKLRGETTYRPYHLPASTVRCFFRDDHLSDLVGLEYATWHPEDAVANLICHLEEIAHTAAQTDAQVVSIILDGENAWELYPENGYAFLSTLYQKLSEHPKLELTTFSQCLDMGTAELPKLVAGSWVYGNFSTWIGEPDKNRGWEMLDQAKQVFDKVIQRLTPAQRAAAERQLAVCEGSDWCWWFGDYNPATTVREFDRLYRLHLTNLYQLLNEVPPTYLSQAGAAEKRD